MTARNGQQYLQGLDDDRIVWLGGKRVHVASEPAFAGSRAGMAGYFDWQLAHADDCLVADPVSGEPMNASLLVPHNRDDLNRRHRCIDRLARYSCGMLGRTPDYVNVTLAGFVARADVFAGTNNRDGAARLARFHREVIERDLALTHTIIHPAIDKGIGELDGINGELATRVVRRTAEGIVIRGAKILATLGPFADELFVYPGPPHPKGASPDYAVAFSIPVATPGLHTVCRDHYGADGAIADRPFSTRFDEQDAFVIFDDVLVPWERVFIDGDLAAYNNIMREGWAANIMQQTAIRAAVKLEFAYDLCTRMARATNAEERGDTPQMLGELWGYAQLTRSAIAAAETNARDWGNGAYFCDDRPLRALRSIMPLWLPRVNEIIKLIGSHNLLATAADAAFAAPELGPLVEKYMPGANGVTARERARLFRTAWDFCGSALGGRVELYERFYLASRARNLALDHVVAQKSESWNNVAEFMKASGI